MLRSLRGAFILWLAIALGVYVVGISLAIADNASAPSAINQPSGNPGGTQPSNPGGGGTPVGNLGGSTNPSGGTTGGTTNPGGTPQQVNGFDPDHGISFAALTAAQQDAYDQLLEHLVAREESFDIQNTDPNALDRAYDAVRYDHPELFWLEGYSYSMLPSSTTITVTPSFVFTQQEIDSLTQEIESAADAALATIPTQGSTYEKVRAIYEWVVLQTDYQEGPNDQTIVGVFLDESAVCAGYSRAFQYLCHKLEIPCSYVSGTVDGRGNHAWCLVNIDGTNTYVDVTWGDPVFEDPSQADPDNINYDYLCVTSEELYRDRSATSPTSGLPICDSTQYDYYVLSGTYVDTLGDDGIAAYVGQAANAGESSVGMKFSTQEDYDTAVSFLESDDLFSLGVLPSTATTISYRTNETLRIIEISWE